MADAAPPEEPRPSRKPKYTKLTQQELPACQPVLDPVWVIFIFIAVSVVFVPIGGVCLAYGLKAKEAVFRYDRFQTASNGSCVPSTASLTEIKEQIFKNAKLNTSALTCTMQVLLEGEWTSPIYVYYQLDAFYQNHRRYHKSRSDAQLANSNKQVDLETCTPRIEDANDSNILPCGLIAWSYFNDSFKVGESDFSISGRGIAPRADVEERFADIYPSKNFFPTNESERGGANITKTLKEDERFVIWMRTAALPRFRKLWGKINLPRSTITNQTLTVSITNQYNSFEYGGSKSLVFATTTWLGGRSMFLGIAYLVTGGTSLLMAAVYGVMYLVKRPGSHNDGVNPH